MALFGGLAEPVLRFAFVLRHAIAVMEQGGEPPLRINIALGGGLAEPACRRGLVLRHVPALEAGICPGELLRLGQRIPRHIFFEIFQDGLRLFIAFAAALRSQSAASALSCGLPSAPLA